MKKPANRLRRSLPITPMMLGLGIMPPAWLRRPAPKKLRQHVAEKLIDEINDKLLTSRKTFNHYGGGGFYMILHDVNPNNASDTTAAFRICRRVRNLYARYGWSIKFRSNENGPIFGFPNSGQAMWIIIRAERKKRKMMNLMMRMTKTTHKFPS